VTAERTVEVFQEEMSQVRKMVRDSETKRHEGLAPLRWVASLTVSNLSYDPSFPIEGGGSVASDFGAEGVGDCCFVAKVFPRQRIGHRVASWDTAWWWLVSFR